MRHLVQFSLFLIYMWPFKNTMLNLQFTEAFSIILILSKQSWFTLAEGLVMFGFFKMTQQASVVNVKDYQISPICGSFYYIFHWCPKCLCGSLWGNNSPISILVPASYLLCYEFFPENYFAAEDHSILGETVNGQKLQSGHFQGEIKLRSLLQKVQTNFSLVGAYLFLQVHHFGKRLAQLIYSCHGNVIFPSSKAITGTWQAYLCTHAFKSSSFHGNPSNCRTGFLTCCHFTNTGQAVLHKIPV